MVGVGGTGFCGSAGGTLGERGEGWEEGGVGGRRRETVDRGAGYIT